MSGYRRFIAYVYEYQQGRKGAGKGFIKVEAKNGVCRIRYKLAGIFGKGEGTAEVIGYIREGDRCRGVRLGRWTSAGSSAEFEQELDEENLNGSGYSLNDLCGLLLLTDMGEVYGSGWDDRPLNPGEIQLPMQEEEGRSVRQEMPEREQETTDRAQEEIRQEREMPERDQAMPQQDREMRREHPGQNQAAWQRDQPVAEWERERSMPGSESGFQLEPDTGSESGFRSEPQAGPEQGFQSEPETGTERGFQSEPETGIEQGFRSEPQTGTEQGFQPEPETRSERGFRPESETETEQGFRSEPETGSEQRFQPEPETGAEQRFQSDAQRRPEQGFQSVPETRRVIPRQGPTIPRGSQNAPGQNPFLTGPEQSFQSMPGQQRNTVSERETAGRTAEEREQEIREIEEEEMEAVPPIEMNEPEQSTLPGPEDAGEERLRGQSAACAQRQMPLFGDEETVRYMQIQMKDLCCLGRRDRGLANNNFLRRGASRYGYLLLGQRKADGTFFLGVPGVYERQECLMANLCGFPYFREACRCGRNQGRFGYWYRFLDTPDLNRLEGNTYFS